MARRGLDAEAKQGLTLIAPPFLYALLVLAAPVLTILSYSFLKDGYLEVIREFTWANYTQVFTDPIVRTVMLRSLFVSGLVTLVTVVLAFPVAYYVSFVVRPERKSMWLFLITIPFWTSYLIRVFLWKVILGYNGVINSSLTGLGIIDEPLTFILYNVNAMVLTLAHAYAPFAILPIFVALEKIDRSLLEAGRDLGESRLMTFWRVTLPLAMPGVIAATLIVFIPTIGDYVTPEVIGGGKIPMIANLIQVQMLALDNRPLGSALAVTAMLIVAAVSVVFLFVNRRFLKVRQ
ncbi:ABC transporter permease [Paracoccus sp. R12_1]|jgi:spermidine/putrescine transport system permease protein|uniref:ABC transporter permease n=1 Tax=unclassified Paracoccus (in: a-proteobacteria) TaxID=2688777 RepID=UPI001ADA2194|nr:MULTISPECIES: ABC transporter permease [unclassified Paracoccus (in: a-proteobacteria)]MBO9454374.1 ABC transporter permease [Paracoccus sp. R12_2]MBO9485160.1 ABC transporter permease [Paracoccus sp. R12_1]